MLVTIPAAILSSLFIDQEIFEGDIAFGAFAASMLFVVGPVEEVSKFAAARLGAYRSMYFEEPLDGLVHGVAASLGFATLENMFYMLEFGPEVLLVRGPLSTLGHVVFGASWGYALGLYIQQPSRRRRFALVLGIAGAAIVHGLFNISLAFAPILALLLIALGMAWTLSRFDWGLKVSPFRYRRNYPLGTCRSCGEMIRATSHYCRFCGSVTNGNSKTLICGQCNATNRPDASFCVQCGDRFVS